MLLNGAQVVALYSLCTELGFGQHLKFEVMSQEEASGDVLVDVSGDLLIGHGRYKLFGTGGRHFLGGAERVDTSDPVADSLSHETL